MKKIILSFIIFVFLFSSSFALLNVGYESPIVKVVEEKSPAVVNIEATRRSATQMDPYFEEFFRRFFGDQIPGYERESTGLGTGFIFNKEGYIITNYHVVQNSTNINVVLSDDRKLKASMVGGDQVLDIAVLKINSNEELPTISFGDSDSLKIGEWAIAIGNPLGLEHTVTVGVISAVNRKIPKPDGSGHYLDLIQTDAAINPGNSGGPLLNIHGEVVGINTAIINPQFGINLGFAIPVNSIKSFVNSLIEHGRVDMAYLGVYHETVTEMLQRAVGLKVDKGSYINDVVEGTAAEKYGIKPGDVIVKMDNRTIEGAGDLAAVMRTYRPGDKVIITINRYGEEIKLEVILGKSETETVARISPDYFGLVVRDIKDEDLKDLSISRQITGVIIEEVKSEAEAIGVKEGDIVTEIFVNGVRHDIENLEHWEEVASKVSKDSYIALIILRENIRFNVRFYY